MTPSRVLLSLSIICTASVQSILSESPDNFECASIHLSDNKTTVQILNNEFIEQEKFEIIRAGKLENAKFTINEYPEHQKKCLLEICGYNSQNSENPYYYGNCEWYNSSSNGKPINASLNIYDIDYDLSSTSCSCTSPSSSCASNSCSAKFATKTWKDDECAVLFREKNCSTCHFPTTNLSRNQSFYTLNNYQFRSMIIRPGCKVDTVSKIGLDRNEEWESFTINYYLAPLIVPSIWETVHKDTDNFTCYCNDTESYQSTNSNAFSSTLEYVTNTATSSSSETYSTSDNFFASSQDSIAKDAQEFTFSVFHYIIIIGFVVTLVTVISFLIMFLKMKNRAEEVKNCENNTHTVADIDSSVSCGYNANEVTKVQPKSSEVCSESMEISECSMQATNCLENREVKLKLEIMDGFKQLMDSLIPSTDLDEHVTSPNTKNCELATRSNLLQLNQIYHPEYEVTRDSFRISKKNLENPLGSGQFGIVYKGSLKYKTDGLQKVVAVKKINWHPDSDETLVQSFVQEVKTFHHIDNGNVNIVGYFGACCHSDGLYILTEYCEHGSLKSYLSHNLGPKILSEQTSLRTTEFTTIVGGDYFVTNQVAEESMQNHKPTMSTKYLRQFFHWCEQIACGMEYLGEKGIIHVDLATRNILLSSSKFVNGEEEYDIKICDFGLSKRCLNTENYAKSLLSGDFPFNSFAPECVSGEPKKISIYLDVWAYGCTIWEIFMLGGSLYPDLAERGIHKFMAVKKLLQEGFKHPKPPLAPEVVYNEIMLKCWERVPRNRPNFTELCDFFTMSRVECL